MLHSMGNYSNSVIWRLSKTGERREESEVNHFTVCDVMARKFFMSKNTHSMYINRRMHLRKFVQKPNDLMYITWDGNLNI